MKTWHAGAVAFAAVALVYVMAISLVGRLTEEVAPPVSGAIALGTAEDGELLIRTHMCRDQPGDVTVTRGSTDASGERVLATFEGAETIRAVVPRADLFSSTTLLIIADGTEGVTATLDEWQAIKFDQWLVTQPGSAGSHNAILTENELVDWVC